MKRAKSGGSAHKHKGTAKHHATAKHNHPAGAPGHNITHGQGGGSAPAVVARHPSHPKARKLALGDTVACCAAESLAASIRLAGGSVADADVLALYRATCSDPEEGQSLSVALSAAQEHSLGGWFPVYAEEVMPYDRWSRRSADDLPRGPEPLVTGRAGLILGVELPGPHAVAVGSDGAWWSWGEPYDPATWPDAVVEEAWLVGWSR